MRYGLHLLMQMHGQIRHTEDWGDREAKGFSVLLFGRGAYRAALAPVRIAPPTPRPISERWLALAASQQVVGRSLPRALCCHRPKKTSRSRMLAKPPQDSGY